MTQRVNCLFYLFRYVPDIVRGEFVNIGVALHVAADWQKGEDDWSRSTNYVKFTRDWQRVKGLHRKADSKMLTSIALDLESQLTGGNSATVFVSLRDTLSNSIQMTDPQGYLTDSASIGLEELFERYVR